MSSTYDQQPTRRTVGKRKTRDGRPLSHADRAALVHQAQYRTRVPKGVFIYSPQRAMSSPTINAMRFASTMSSRLM